MVGQTIERGWRDFAEHVRDAETVEPRLAFYAGATHVLRVLVDRSAVDRDDVADLARELVAAVARAPRDRS